MKKAKVIIVMPAYQAETTLKQTVSTIPVQLRSQTILSDDASKDRTTALAKQLGLKTFRHPHNLGYGGNQKTGYWEALKEKPDIVVMLHPDMQYDGSLISQLIEPLISRRADIMLGSRIRSRQAALSGGMPLIKYLINRLFTLLENIILGANLSDHFTGFRAYRRQVLETLPFQRFGNDFIFDQQLIISAVYHHFTIDEIYIPTHYGQESSSIGYLRGAKFLSETLLALFLFLLAKTRIFIVSWLKP